MEHMGYAWHMERYAGIIVVVLLVVDGQFNMFENVADVLSACSTPTHFQYVPSIMLQLTFLACATEAAILGHCTVIGISDFNDLLDHICMYVHIYILYIYTVYTCIYSLQDG